MKPVAYAMFKDGEYYDAIHPDEQAKTVGEYDTPLYTHPVKKLTDEEWNKAFDCYCETDEGVLRFDYELRDEWKKEQLIRWKEALRKAQE
jgi:hypothetical protein